MPKARTWFGIEGICAEDTLRKLEALQRVRLVSVEDTSEETKRLNLEFDAENIEERDRLYDDIGDALHALAQGSRPGPENDFRNEVKAIRKTLSEKSRSERRRLN